MKNKEKIDENKAIRENITIWTDKISEKRISR